jgi:hypothetical protein
MKLCARCGRDHSNDIPFDEQKALGDAAAELARGMDRELLKTMMLAASNIMVDKGEGFDGGYEIGTREKYEEFVKKRNYPLKGSE